MCITWFILSAADNYWLDLNKIIHGDREIPVYATEAEKSAWYRNFIRNNPHIVDTYFRNRVHDFIKTFLAQKDQNINGIGLYGVSSYRYSTCLWLFKTKR